MAALNLPRQFFLAPSGLDDPQNKSQIFWRSRSTSTQQARKRAERRFNWIKEIVQYLLDFVELPALNLLHLHVPSDPQDISKRVVEDAAMKCRSAWNMGAAPIADLVLLMENNGLMVSRTDLMDDKLSSFSQIDNIGAWIILGEDFGSAVRSRFSAAHELGHLVLHREISVKQNHKLQEEQAFHFASAFLLPEKSFMDELWAPTLDAFLSLKDRWKVAVAAMIMRCRQLGLLSQEQEQRMWINYGRRRWRHEEPLDDVIPIERPRLLKRCFDLVTREGIRTRQQILSDLRFAASDIEALCGLSSGYFDDDKYDPPKVTPIPADRQRKGSGGGGGQVIQFKRPKQ